MLVSKLNPERGAVIHADKHRIPTVCSPEFIALKPRLVDARYTYYLMLSGPVRACLESSVESVTNSHKRARVDRFLASRVEVPDLSTQKAIADFLDRETVRIDQLIEKKGRLVEALQSKRISLISEAVTTGIDDSLDLVETNSQFVPKIPHGWKLWRLKYLADVRGGLTIGRAVPIERPVFPVSYLRVANVQAGWIDLSDVAEIHATSSEVEKYSLAEGDVLMNEGGTTTSLVGVPCGRLHSTLVFTKTIYFACARGRDITRSGYRWLRMLNMRETSSFYTRTKAPISPPYQEAICSNFL